MFSIGEFSKITGLTVKSLRFYHERQLLEPAHVDPQTGYRYYNERNVTTARIIVQLRQLEFSLEEIGAILAEFDDEADMVDWLAQKRDSLRGKIEHQTGVLEKIERILTKEQEAQMAMKQSSFQVEEKEIDAITIAGIRMKGKYSECGKGFARIGRSFGRWISGKPMLLIYDQEYREEDADYETCIPLKSSSDRKVEGISVRTLDGGRCLSLLHRGPYDQLGRSYEKLLAYAKERQFQVLAPCREIYIKGPGMIFKGNPQKYLTEIQWLFEPASKANEQKP